MINANLSKISINYILLDKLSEKYYDDILQLITLTDKEFCPPLSSRVSTTQENFHLNNKNSEENSIFLYFKSLLKQSFILASVNYNVVGFLSYIKNHTITDVDIIRENAYVSTICINPDYRRRGITNCFYEKLETDENNKLIFTRTWNQNYSHINLLIKRNYELIHEIVNDRANGIDTVYYAKKLGRFAV